MYATSQEKIHMGLLYLKPSRLREAAPQGLDNECWCPSPLTNYDAQMDGFT